MERKVGGARCASTRCGDATASAKAHLSISSRPRRTCRGLLTDIPALRARLLAAFALQVVSIAAAAQDATWSPTPSPSPPASADFNAGTNWIGGLVPTGTASFNATTNPAITFSAAATDIGGWFFSVGSAKYTFTLSSQLLEFHSAGVTINGGGVSITNNISGSTYFKNTSTAGDARITNNNFGVTFFNDYSTAGKSDYYKS